MATKAEIMDILESVTDPEIPVLTVNDLGIIRGVNFEQEGRVEVVITPTYSGCPAMNTIEMEIVATLARHGFQNAKVSTVLSPAWTTAWISESGKQKMKDYGIAPPLEESPDKSLLFAPERQIQCPRCASFNTVMISQFGSTACKALHKCKDCLEPFDYFKCH